MMGRSTRWRMSLWSSCSGGPPHRAPWKGSETLTEITLMEGIHTSPPYGPLPFMLDLNDTSTVLEMKAAHRQHQLSFTRTATRVEPVNNPVARAVLPGNRYSACKEVSADEEGAHLDHKKCPRHQRIQVSKIATMPIDLTQTRHRMR
jgi:hypothetical protein